jgi:hypothetical protein
MQHLLVGVCDRVNSRIEKQFTRSGDLLKGWQKVSLAPVGPPVQNGPHRSHQVPQKPKLEFSDDYRKVWVHGALYLLTPGQGKMLRVLWDAYKEGTGAVTRTALRQAIGTGFSGDPRDTWKGHPLWGTLIGYPKPGFYQLDHSIVK